MDEEGKYEPEEAHEWSRRADNNSPSTADPAVHPAFTNAIQSYGQNGSYDDSHNPEDHDRHENCEASHIVKNLSLSGRVKAGGMALAPVNCAGASITALIVNCGGGKFKSAV